MDKTPQWGTSLFLKSSLCHNYNSWGVTNIQECVNLFDSGEFHSGLASVREISETVVCVEACNLANEMPANSPASPCISVNGTCQFHMPWYQVIVVKYAAY